jgi:hypothetical protein
MFNHVETFNCMTRTVFLTAFFLLGLLFTACKKEVTPSPDGYTFYQVAFNSTNADWRDTAFVVRTNNAALIQKADAQLALPVAQRQIVFGELATGDGGYNKNAGFSFNWHFKEGWDLVDVTAEIYDGKPYTDVHQNPVYWQETMKRFGAWSSYLRKKLPGKP